MAEPVIVTTPNPVGEPKDLKEVTDFIENVALMWKERIKTIAKENRFRNAVGFILGALDGLIKIVDGLLDAGPDKKATVMAAVVLLYDYIVGPALPLYLKPFAKAIKIFIIDVIISLSIDFIVNKYRNGTWTKDDTQPTTSKEAHAQERKEEH